MIGAISPFSLRFSAIRPITFVNEANDPITLSIGTINSCRVAAARVANEQNARVVWPEWSVPVDGAPYNVMNAQQDFYMVVDDASDAGDVAEFDKIWDGMSPPHQRNLPDNPVRTRCQDQGYGNMSRMMQLGYLDRAERDNPFEVVVTQADEAGSKTFGDEARRQMLADL